MRRRLRTSQLHANARKLGDVHRQNRTLVKMNGNVLKTVLTQSIFGDESIVSDSISKA
jgi:hypothetical protein